MPRKAKITFEGTQGELAKYGYTLRELNAIGVPRGGFRYEIKVVCPKGHTFEIRKDHFAPHKGKTGCMTCYNAAKVHRSHNNLREWLASYNLRLPRDYSTRSTYCVWECGNGHTFHTNMQMLQKAITLMGKRSVYRTPEHLCVYCDVADCEERWPVLMKSHHDGSLKRGDPIRWECLMCGGDFVTLLRHMQGCPACDVAHMKGRRTRGHMCKDE